MKKIYKRMPITKFAIVCASVCSAVNGIAETLNEVAAKASAEGEAAYNNSPYSALSKDYFSRFSADPAAKPNEREMKIEPGWRVTMDTNLPMRGQLSTSIQEFLPHLGVEVSIEPTNGLLTSDHLIQIRVSELELEKSPEGTFTLSISAHHIEICGKDIAGARDGVVRLCDMMALRQAPILPIGRFLFTPRIPVRLGVIPKGGSYKDLVFMGYNAVSAGGGSIYALSTSNAIPELAGRRAAGANAANKKIADAAREYGLKTYAFLDARQKFPENDPVFKAHPDIRGARTWKADGEFVLCTEHPLVQQYLEESIKSIFQNDPKLDGVVIIIGGEGFYHCFMRPFGAEKGHTTCPRCEALGPDTVVSDLCNRLAAAARTINPNAEVVAWPYSAEHVWSSDKAQSGFIAKLKPGTAIFTEIEKDEVVEKPEGVKKALWDYSIDLIGPGQRAKDQIAACHKAGIPIYLKSEPEISLEAPRLPHIPCMDRWAARAEALASSDASGAWVMPAFRANYGSSAAEVNKFFWWHGEQTATPGSAGGPPANATSPITAMFMGDPKPEPVLGAFANRIAGNEAGPHLRKAWKFVSDAIEQIPEIPSYYTGPYYLGPAHPMVVDPAAPVPDIFLGHYLFMAEISDDEGLKKRPTYVTKPTGNVPVFGRYYRRMEGLLKQAADEMNTARPLVPERCKLMFNAEDSPVQWFYRTARTEANFYESCQIRDEWQAYKAKADHTAEEKAAMKPKLTRWLEILRDEQENAKAAVPIMNADPRLDFAYGGDHTFSHGKDMLEAKLKLIAAEISVVEGYTKANQ